MADQTNDNTTCVVCFKNVLYYSIGECDHPVCFECSTRMRVLCLQNECPICRQDLGRVVFTETVRPYKDFRTQAFSDKMFDRQFKIGFCSGAIKNAYVELLESRCGICEDLPPFRNFSSLSDHMRKVHEKYYCDLCVKHLRIFTSERKCYTRQELAHHRRKGDLDDTSHSVTGWEESCANESQCNWMGQFYSQRVTLRKSCVTGWEKRGHPLCEFCEERFMDADELYRHLRKEHLYCHLCDADGRNHYYASHSALAHHFRTEHYLCEEGECAGQHLTAVFRSEIDLIAHKAQIHGKGLARAAARQARTLELQFNITPHTVAQRNHQNTRDRDREPAPQSPPLQVLPAHIDTRSDAEFPSLGPAPAPPSLLGSAPARLYKGGDGLVRTDKNFPALAGGAAPPPRPAPSGPVAATLVRNSKPSVSIQLHSQPASASNFRLTQPTGNRISIPPQSKKPQLNALSDDDFPSLGMARDDHPSIGAATVQQPKVTLINSDEMKALKKNPTHQQSKKPQHGGEAFPALSGGGGSPSAPPQWIKIAKSKEKVKAKPEPPPPRERNFNPLADFPTLPNAPNPKPKAKKVAPAPQIPITQPEPQKTKKEKKKKKENVTDVNGPEKKAREANQSQVLANVNFNTDENTNEAPITEKNQNGGNGDFSFAAKDYPPLSKNATSAPVKVNGSVPPGFAKRPACDGLKFTNSSGQTFSAPLHQYIPPPNFEGRNRALVKKFATALGSSAAMEEFKSASRAFRDSVITADEFYSHCQSALGSKLDDLFSEMIALLPDIGKQQELVVGRKPQVQLDVCTTCGQLLAHADLITHDTAHWPPLSSH